MPTKSKPSAVSKKSKIDKSEVENPKVESPEVVESPKVVVEIPEVVQPEVQKHTNETNSSSSDESNTKVTEEINPVNMYVSKLNNYVERISKMNKELKDLVSVGKGLEKEFNSIIKIMSKKNKTKSENRPLSGFAMPSKLSDELYEFLNINKGDKVPRKDVTRMINEYITCNNLRDEKDKRVIKPNAELHKIFKSCDKDEITYFNLQSYMKHHFIKDVLV